MTKQTPVTLDYEDQLQGLIDFLKSTDTFKDYNYEGSNIRELCRLLAYNSTLEAYKSNVIFNELHLDTAEQDNNIASIASMLMYTPRSIKASEYKVSFVVTDSTSPTPSPTLTLEKQNTRAAVNSDNETKIFMPDQDYIANLVNGNQYIFDEVTLLEGTWVSNTWTYAGSRSPEFVIPNENIDINTLQVVVQTSESDSTQTVYNRFYTAHDLGKDEPVYYLTKNLDGLYQIKFGDDNISKALEDGNIVIISYLVTSGPAANNLSGLKLKTGIGGIGNAVMNNISQYSAGGTEPESSYSIKTLAPLSFASRGNCVSVNDYKVKTFELLPQASDVDVWDGVDNVPPQASYVYIAVKPEGEDALTPTEKNFLIDGLKKYNIGSVTPIIVDPEYVYINLDTEITYDPAKTTFDQGALITRVKEFIGIYSSERLEQFAVPFYHQSLEAFITSIDGSFLSNNTKVSYERRIVPLLNVDNTIEVETIKKIKPGSIKGTGFSISHIGDLTFDFVDENGVLKLVQIDLIGSRHTIGEIGHVDYEKGIIQLVGFRPNSLEDGYLKIKYETSEPVADLFPYRIFVPTINEKNITFTIPLGANNVSIS